MNKVNQTASLANLLNGKYPSRQVQQMAVILALIAGVIGLIIALTWGVCYCLANSTSVADPSVPTFYALLGCVSAIFLFLTCLMLVHKHGKESK